MVEVAGLSGSVSMLFLFLSSIPLYPFLSHSISTLISSLDYYCSRLPAY